MCLNFYFSFFEIFSITALMVYIFFISRVQYNNFWEKTLFKLKSEQGGSAGKFRNYLASKPTFFQKQI